MTCPEHTDYDALLSEVTELRARLQQATQFDCGDGWEVSRYYETWRADRYGSVLTIDGRVLTSDEVDVLPDTLFAFPTAEAAVDGIAAYRKEHP